MDRTIGKYEKRVDVNLPKDVLIAILIECPVEATRLSIQVEGKDLDLEIVNSSRFEVVLDEKWEVPQRIDGDKPYPWIHDQEIRLVQDIEKYRFIYITAVNGNNYINELISPVCMTGTSWKIEIYGVIALEFIGSNHQTLKIESKQGFSIVNMYGIAC